jgi:predicted Zn-dependent protease
MRFSLCTILALCFLSADCQQNRKAESTNIQTKRHPSTTVLPTLTVHQKELLALYEHAIAQLNVRNVRDCNDLFDNITARINDAQTAALNLYGQPVSSSEERAYGYELFEGVKEQYHIIDQDPRRTQLMEILNRLIVFRERKDIKYTIHLIDHTMVNAFSVAGGHIHITTGLLNKLESTEELVFVIGHEIAHVDKKHCLRKIQILKTADKAFGKIGTVVGNIQLILAAPFGQADEYEADRTGTNFMYQAGYDVNKASDFFDRIEEDSAQNTAERFRRTHPYSANRKKCLEEYISTEFKK